MRILYSANNMHSVMQDGYDRHSILKYLRRLGHDVTVDESPKSTEGYDLFIGIVSCGCKLEKNVIARSGVPTALYCVDDYVRFNMYKNLMFAADYVFTIDQNIINQYPDKKIHFLPPAADPEIFKPKHKPLSERKYKVSFVGNCSYPNRKELIRILTDEFGSDFHCFGWKSPQEGRNREYSCEEVNNIFNDTVVNVDMTYRGVLNNRAFEVPMSGNMLVSDANGDYITKRCGFWGYYDLDGLVGTCRMFLDMDIDKVIKIGHSNVSNETWENRVKELLDIVG